MRRCRLKSRRTRRKRKRRRKWRTMCIKSITEERLKRGIGEARGEPARRVTGGEQV